MGKVIYTIHDFDYQKALSGKLCIMVKNGYQPDDTKTIANDSSSFGGAGICRKSGSSNVSITIGGEEFIFSREGLPSSPNTYSPDTHLDDWILKLATTDTAVTEIGTSVSSNSEATVTRGQTAEAEDVSYGDYGKWKSIDTMYPRDQFAAQALRGILSHIDNPAELSKNEMDYYCNAAYDWASLMMTAAANARPSTINNGESQSAEVVPVTSLDNNTEILLNNLIAELAKTNTIVNSSENSAENPEDSESTESPEYAERIAAPDVERRLTAIIGILNQYVAHTPTGSEPATKTTSGLDDLIAAIRGISSGGGGGGGSSFDGNITGMPDINIGNMGLGRDNSHPIYISGGGFPTKNALAAEMYGDDTKGATKQATSFVTFNSNGAVGWMNLEEIIRIQDIKDSIENTIKAWLRAITIQVSTTIGGTSYPGTVTVKIPSTLPSNAPETTPEETEQGGE